MPLTLRVLTCAAWGAGHPPAALSMGGQHVAHGLSPIREENVIFKILGLDSGT